MIKKKKKQAMLLFTMTEQLPFDSIWQAVQEQAKETVTLGHERKIFSS